MTLCEKGDFMSKIKRTNAERFIISYNSIDHSLRTIYGFKRSISFADLIRKAVPLNSVVRKYEDELIDYGRLRNSIVHRTNPNYVIAEPHDDVVIEFEKIARLIATPPTALDRVCHNEVLIGHKDMTLRELLEIMSTTGYKNIPIYEEDSLLGVAIGGRVLEHLGSALKSGVDAMKYINDTSVLEVMSVIGEEGFFKVADKNITIERALNYFYLNRKLQIIIINENGSMKGQPLGVVTVADILDMNGVLENY